MGPTSLPLRLRLSAPALTANWRWLRERSGAAACGAAVKADGYGLGAVDVVRHLRAAGCRDFFVATWAEAEALTRAGQGDGLSVLHGVRAEDMPLALSLPGARPVLNTAAQVARWRDAGADLPCDVMIDTGMNRLGLTPEEAASGLLDGLRIETVMSHLASADQDVPTNDQQLRDFLSATTGLNAGRRSIANSAGICLGSDYALDLTRPGLAIYGGIPRAEALSAIGQVCVPEVQIVQRRTVVRGQAVGYNAMWRATEDTTVAIINIGYADGYLRVFSDRGSARFESWRLPVIGRVSMDLTALRVPQDCPAQEGDWVTLDYDLADASVQSGLSPYELLTGLGRRYQRYWV